MKVKVCGMTDKENVKEVVDAGPDYLGFIFFQGSKRYVGDSRLRSFFESVPATIIRTGVFVDEDIKYVVEKAKTFNLGLIQLHGSESPDYCGAIREKGFNVVKSFGIAGMDDLERTGVYIDSCDYFLFDSKTDGYGGSGLSFRWDILSGLGFDKPFFLSGGIGPDDTGLIKALKHESLYAVDINSRFETSPGIKDAALVREFINSLNDR